VDTRLTRPLSGIRVLDLSQVLAGPYCGMLLAGLGAEVIKIEGPEGDLSRSMGPPYLGDSGTLYLYTNRNKKSLVLDLKRVEGQNALHRLVRRADVLIHNSLPRSARKLRIDYPTLSSINPRLIYATVSAFGQTGPRAGRPGFDAVFQAVGGLMSLTGPARGKGSKAAASVVDVGTGILTALGILACLLKRRQTGNGARVGGALLDTVLALQGNLFTYSSVIGDDPRRVGNGSYFMISNCFSTADGQLMVSLPTSRFWQKFCQALGQPSLQSDSRFSSHQGRISNKPALESVLARIFRTKTTAQWLRILQPVVPCGALLSYKQVIQDQQVRHNGLFKMDVYKGSRYRVVRSPIRLDGKLMDGRLAAPSLGQHTRQILRAARFTRAEILELDRLGVTIPSPSPKRPH
jgi:crotonobetainyl-CoA:carnitine CoA-transferase CaiB-like acyl-CoA transferase